MTRDYSAQVQIELHIAGMRIPVAQVGGDRLIFDRPTTLPASGGEVLLVMHIDGHEHRWRVTVQPSPSSQSAPSTRVVLAEFDEIIGDGATLEAGERR